MVWTKEILPYGGVAYTAPEFRFQTDSLRLAAFAKPQDGERVCDLGSGCGCIPLWWLDSGCRPIVDGIDCQEEGIRLATASAEENGWKDYFRPLLQDWHGLDLPFGEYDRVVCNPPYFAKDEGRISPDKRRKTARQEDGDGIMGWLSPAAKLLRDGGRLCVCYRPERLTALLSAMQEVGCEPKRLQLVQRRADTAPWLVLCEARKSAHHGLQIEPVWIENTD